MGALKLETAISNLRDSRESHMWVFKSLKVNTLNGEKYIWNT